MTLQNRALVALALGCALLCGWLGWRLHGTQALLTETHTQLDSLTKEHTETLVRLDEAQHAVTDSHLIKTVTTDVVKKDGTRSHTVTSVKEDTKVDTTTDTASSTSQHTEKEVEAHESVSQVSKPVDAQAISRYSVEVWRDGLPTPTDWHPNVLTAGARLGNLPVWLSAGWSLRSHAPLIGIRGEL